MARYFSIFVSLLLVSILITAHADMYYNKGMYPQPKQPGKVIHVHHYDGGSSGMNTMKGGHKGMMSSGSGDLIELLLLSQLLGGNGLFGNNNNNNGGNNGNGVLG